jgi:hypothetical protein
MMVRTSRDIWASRSAQVKDSSSRWMWARVQRALVLDDWVANKQYGLYDV